MSGVLAIRARAALSAIRARVWRARRRVALALVVLLASPFVLVGILALATPLPAAHSNLPLTRSMIRCITAIFSILSLIRMRWNACVVRCAKGNVMTRN